MPQFFDPVLDDVGRDHPRRLFPLVRRTSARAAAVSLPLPASYVRALHHSVGFGGASLGSAGLAAGEFSWR